MLDVTIATARVVGVPDGKIAELLRVHALVLEQADFDFDNWRGNLPQA